MRSFFSKAGFIIFWFIAVINIFGAVINNNAIHFITKPLLLPVLIITLLAKTHSTPKRFLLIAGLIFSFAGDVFLLFENSNPLFFIFGLVAFLITHIFYILFFLSIKKQKPYLLKQLPYLALLIIIYCSALLYLLIPKLGSITIPVIIYALILSSMLLSSFIAYNNFSKMAAQFFSVGAVFFVVSDSLLAINKFYSPVLYPGIVIMATYCLAQYLIVKGFIKLQ